MNKRQLQKVKKQALAKKRGKPQNVQAAWDMVAQELHRDAKQNTTKASVCYFVDQDFITKQIQVYSTRKTVITTTLGVIK